MSMEAQATIDNMWKQTRCALPGNWMNSIQYKYTVESYSAIKVNELLMIVTEWVQLEIINASGKMPGL